MHRPSAVGNERSAALGVGRVVVWLTIAMAPYALQCILGGGSFATVVIATMEDGSARALKVLHRDRCGDATSVGRFRDEARILRQIQHPNIVHAHALHRYGDRLVIELDFVDGLSLDHVLGPPPHRLDLPEVLAIAQPVAEALWSAWSDPWSGKPMHIVHRDVNPANVVLDRGGHVWLLDFGIAKGSFEGREAMSLYDIGGTIGYLAPERKDGEAGPPVDVYALAAMVVHLLGDRLLLPQRPDRHDEVARTVLQRLELPDGLCALLGEMLAYDPSQRPTMGEVAARLVGLRAELPAADLPRLAAERVAPQLAERPERDPREHRRYSDVAFLEVEVPDPPDLPMSVRDAQRRLRDLLASPDWPRRLDEVKRISRASTPPVETPLLDVLQRVEPPWWRPLARRSTAEEAEAALLVLGDQPSETTLEAARQLAEHRDPRIRKAARFVLQRGR